MLLRASAQSGSLLEKRLSLRVRDAPLDDVLQQIGALGGFGFSYSPDAIPVGRRVTLNETNRSVRELLYILFEETVVYKEKKKHIILHKSSPVFAAKTETVVFEGYVTDLETSLKLPDASLYEPLSLISTVSNRYGYFKIKLPASPENSTLEVRKEGYRAHSIRVTAKKNSFISVALLPALLPRDTI